MQPYIAPKIAPATPAPPMILLVVTGTNLLQRDKIRTAEAPMNIPKGNNKLAQHRVTHTYLNAGDNREPQIQDSVRLMSAERSHVRSASAYHIIKYTTKGDYAPAKYQACSACWSEDPL